MLMEVKIGLSHGLGGIHTSSQCMLSQDDLPERSEFFLQESEGFREKGWFPSELMVVNGMKIGKSASWIHH